ncbi:TlpA family protein disulfide reductase [Geobacillus subterraneus]|uniref:Thiol:disulfide interchange protein tlpA n=1 Tax=Geobacillus subterraneus TaxID=129338 RepID=A0A679FRZ6_9BACL|nr:TlpA disulfide reductase family protein [Geobacillus subterraneus]BBW98910.1 thiol:disulfide interchange protein tlpA [Geobacillus subterraneus]
MKIKTITAIILCFAALAGCKHQDQPANIAKQHATNQQDQRSQKIAALTDMQQNQAAQQYARTFLGKKAPSFSFADQNGNIHSLQSFKGKKVLLEFASTACPTCQHVHPVLSRWTKKQKQIHWIQVFPIEPKASVERFLKRTHDESQHLVLMMSGHPDATSPDRLIEQYQIDYVPTFLFIDESGKIQMTYIGNVDEATLDHLNRLAFQEK